MKSIEKTEILFETKDIFGKNVRTTKSYWQKIFLIKHKEVKASQDTIIKSLQKPDEVRRSVTDSTILLYAQEQEKYDILIVAVKVLNGDGFLVTVYQTKEFKKKGELLWPKQKEK